MMEAVNWANIHIHTIHITSIKRIADQRDFASDFAFFEQLHFCCTSRQFLHWFSRHHHNLTLQQGETLFTCRVGIRVGVWNHENFASVTCLFALACFAVYMANNKNNNYPAFQCKYFNRASPKTPILMYCMAL